MVHMKSVVNEYRHDQQSSDNVVDVTSLPFFYWNERLKTLNGATIIEESWEYPKTDTEDSHKHIGD